MNIQEIANNLLTFNRDISQFEDTLNQIKNQGEAMFAEMSELDAMWDGQANQMFIAQFNQDYENLKEFCNFSEEILNCLKFAKGEYISCENSVEGIINSIRI